MIAAVVVVLALVVGPFLVPVPALQDTVPPQELVDADSQCITVDGMAFHYKRAGSGEPVFLLLHGFGASTFTWREVMAAFAARGTVVAYDRPAFGLTERPLHWQGENPYSSMAQVSQAIHLLDALHMQRAILIGNSAGGRVAVDIALAHPERVTALILADPAVGISGGPGWLRPFLGTVLSTLLRTPQVNHLGPLLVRQISTRGSDLMTRAWHDPSKLTPAIIAGYRKPLRARDWDAALWQMTRAQRSDDPSARLAALAAVPTLVITGDDDRIVPVAVSEAVAQKIPGSHLVKLATCGHVPQEECPAAFMQSVSSFLDGLPK